MGDFKDAFANYVVCNNRYLRFIKNYKTLVRVGYKEGVDGLHYVSNFQMRIHEN